MRILFVSATTVGGSGRSQRELAQELIRRGHQVTFLVTDQSPRPGARIAQWVYGHLSDLSVRMTGYPGASCLLKIRDAIGATSRWWDVEGLRHLATPVLQNGFRKLIMGRPPDVAVVSSVDRWTWRRIHAFAEQMGVPTVLYIREDDSLEHLELGSLPDRLVANAESLADSMIKRGHQCDFIPSVIDVSVTRVESSRRVALCINPIPSRGSEFIWKLAHGIPDIPIVMQESWPLTDSQLVDVRAHLKKLPNVEFRPKVDPGPAIYEDARVLLVPYLVANRPRVILEAQASGIPVIGANNPALIEAVGTGGMALPLTAVDDWAAAIRRLWNNAEYYGELVSQAHRHASRPEVDPSYIAGQFETVLNSLLSRR